MDDVVLVPRQVLEALTRVHSDSAPRELAAALELLEPQPRRCLVAVCHNGSSVQTETVRSLIELGWGDRVGRAKLEHGFAEISFYWAKNFPRVDTMRDSVMDLARRDGFTHVLFLDADMVWPSDVLHLMLRHHNRGIVCGLYVLRTPPYSPVAMRDRHRKSGSEVDQFYYALEFGTELVAVDVVGMGCCLVPVDVLEKIGPRPWFEYKNDDQGWPLVTEDVPFCLKAKAAGVGVFMDPVVKCGHVQAQVIDVRWHHRYQESMAESGKRMPLTVQTLDPVSDLETKGA